MIFTQRGIFYSVSALFAVAVHVSAATQNAKELLFNYVATVEVAKGLEVINSSDNMYLVKPRGRFTGNAFLYIGDFSGTPLENSSTYLSITTNGFVQQVTQGPQGSKPAASYRNAKQLADAFLKDLGQKVLRITRQRNSRRTAERRYLHKQNGQIYAGLLRVSSYTGRNLETGNWEQKYIVAWGLVRQGLIAKGAGRGIVNSFNSIQIDPLPSYVVGRWSGSSMPLEKNPENRSQAISITYRVPKTPRVALTANRSLTTAENQITTTSISYLANGRLSGSERINGRLVGTIKGSWSVASGTLLFAEYVYRNQTTGRESRMRTQTGFDLREPSTYHRRPQSITEWVYSYRAKSWYKNNLTRVR